MFCGEEPFSGSCSYSVSFAGLSQPLLDFANQKDTLKAGTKSFQFTVTHLIIGPVKAGCWHIFNPLTIVTFLRNFCSSNI